MKAAEISVQLIAHGRDSSTPVAVISRGTRANQQIKSYTLEQLEELAKGAPIPALLVVGEVVALHCELACSQKTTATAAFDASGINLT